MYMTAIDVQGTIKIILINITEKDIGICKK